MLVQQSKATHYRAGEITYQVISDVKNLYHFTFITYTDPRKPANENTRMLHVSWGDGTEQDVNRTKAETINDKVQRNTYEIDHAYSSKGAYLVSFADPNRVENILNINYGYSVDIPFYVEAMLRIDGSIGANESPVLFVPPLDEGCVGFTYVHNPGAYDADGDSLNYQLVPPKQGQNDPVPNYVNPFHSDSFSINSTTGQVTWQKPEQAGIYNIAIRINEYRNNRLVGYVVRDMQIEILACPNAPPVIAPIPDLCVIAGDTVRFLTSASDPNIGQMLTLNGYSGPFEYLTNLNPSPATLTPNPAKGVSFVQAQFTWNTVTNHVRFFDHQGIIKVNDDYGTQMNDIKPFRIKVIAQPPKNLKTTQRGNGFDITWDKDSSGLATYYALYKRIDSSHWNPSNCERGVNPSSGFVLLDTIDGINSTTYYDNDNGKGLSPLVRYCYRLVAIYPARDRYGKALYTYSSESKASTEICDAIIRSMPTITQVSVLKTNATTGRVQLSWLRPDTLDQTQFPPAYKLILKRANNKESTFNTIHTFSYNTFNEINDTTYIDTLLNTSSNQPIYKIEFISDSAGIIEFIDVSPTASSLRAIVYSTDETNILSWNANVPWQNVGFTVYRKKSGNLFDSIAYVKQNTYHDTGLINNQEYCYVIKSYGKYSLLPDSTENLSQEICGTPIDTVRPCPPLLNVITPCNGYGSFTNKIEWINNNACAEDVISYKIYYKQYTKDTSYKLLATVSNTTFSYDDNREILKKGIGGCYVVTGVDSFNNESYIIYPYCVDNCPEYGLPNVFTPNGDGINDLFQPFPYRFIEKVEIQIFNRWGNQVFHTSDPDINWDGTSETSNANCTEGVYFYVATIYEQYLEGVKTRNLKGTIQLLR